jgi:preprotein translocase subunit SecE
MEVKPLVFLQEVREELKKVTWPSRQETTKLTGIVVVISVVVGIYIGALDFVFTKIVAFLVQK